MNRTRHRDVFWSAYIGVCGLVFSVFACPQNTWAQNSVVWESATSLIDTTNYNGLAQYYWFPNIQNPNSLTPVVGAPMDQNEARNLPSWIHLETRSACIGKLDDCTTADTSSRTGFSFTEDGTHTIGAGSIGGQAGFNNLTLPNGLVGRSGQAAETFVPQGGGTSTFAFFRIGANAPSSIRFWVVTDNGSGANFQAQENMRVGLRHIDYPANPESDSDETARVPARPGGQNLITATSDPRANNGIADAWSWKLGGLDENDLIAITATGLIATPGAWPAFGGVMIEVIPEPTGAVLMVLSAAAFFSVGVRRRRPLCR